MPAVTLLSWFLAVHLLIFASAQTFPYALRGGECEVTWSTENPDFVIQPLVSGNASTHSFGMEFISLEINNLTSSSSILQADFPPAWTSSESETDDFKNLNFTTPINGSDLEVTISFYIYKHNATIDEGNQSFPLPEGNLKFSYSINNPTAADLGSDSELQLEHRLTFSSSLSHSSTSTDDALQIQHFETDELSVEIKMPTFYEGNGTEIPSESSFNVSSTPAQMNLIFRANFVNIFYDPEVVVGLSHASETDTAEEESRNPNSLEVTIIFPLVLFVVLIVIAVALIGAVLICHVRSVKLGEAVNKESIEL